MAVHNRPLNYKFMKLGRSVVLCVRMSVALSWIINYLLCTALSRIIPRTKNAIIRPTQTTTIIAVMLPGKKRAKIYVKTPKIMKKTPKNAIMADVAWKVKNQIYVKTAKNYEKRKRTQSWQWYCLKRKGPKVM